jgi:membrane fusion protein (multidrug efflux system)
MNLITFATRGAVITIVFVVASASSGVLGAQKQNGQPQKEHGKIVVTSPKAMDVVITQPYVGHIHSQRHINVCTLAEGYLNEIKVKEGQAVKKGDLLFKIGKAGAKANAEPEKAESDFTEVKAPFDGIVGRLHRQSGSPIKEGDILTTLSDNRVIWVYFNLPERAYLEYMDSRKQDKADPQIELVLANRAKFPERCINVTVEAQFNKERGNIAFRADFNNPLRLLRHGQTGTILMHRKLNHATVIPQRATFEILGKRYVYVVDKDDLAHRREIAVQNEMDDIFVIKRGVGVDDRIVVDGIRQIREGEKVEYEFRPPETYVKTAEEGVNLVEPQKSLSSRSGFPA